ncbi:MAG: SH3 domain-containing protein [Phototrophicaceae bacterium]
MNRKTLVSLLVVVLVMMGLASVVNAQSTITCSTQDGFPNSVVRIGVPAGAVDNGDVFCRVIHNGTDFVLSPAIIGNLGLIQQGVLAAVDVVGNSGSTSVPYFNEPIRTCLRGTGQFFFLANTTSPRQPTTLDAVTDTINNVQHTCAFLSGSGTAVLITGAAAPTVSSLVTTTTTTTTESGATVSSTPSARTTTTTVSGVYTPLASCRITTTAIVRLRTQPSSSATVIERLPYNTNLVATGRVDGWIEVIYLNGQGWLSEGYVDKIGICD